MAREVSKLETLKNALDEQANKAIEIYREAVNKETDTKYPPKKKDIKFFQAKISELSEAHHTAKALKAEALEAEAQKAHALKTDAARQAHEAHKLKEDAHKAETGLQDIISKIHTENKANRNARLKNALTDTLNHLDEIYKYKEIIERTEKEENGAASKAEAGTKKSNSLKDHKEALHKFTKNQSMASNDETKTTMKLDGLGTMRLIDRGISFLDGQLEKITSERSRNEINNKLKELKNDYEKVADKIYAERFKSMHDILTELNSKKEQISQRAYQLNEAINEQENIHDGINQLKVNVEQLKIDLETKNLKEKSPGENATRLSELKKDLQVQLKRLTNQQNKIENLTTVLQEREKLNNEIDNDIQKLDSLRKVDRQDFEKELLQLGSLKNKDIKIEAASTIQTEALLKYGTIGKQLKDLVETTSKSEAAGMEVHLEGIQPEVIKPGIRPNEWIDKNAAISQKLASIADALPEAWQNHAEVALKSKLSPVMEKFEKATKQLTGISQQEMDVNKKLEETKNTEINRIETDLDKLVKYEENLQIDKNIAIAPPEPHVISNALEQSKESQHKLKELQETLKEIELSSRNQVVQNNNEAVLHNNDEALKNEKISVGKAAQKLNANIKNHDLPSPAQRNTISIMKALNPNTQELKAKVENPKPSKLTALWLSLQQKFIALKEKLTALQQKENKNLSEKKDVKPQPLNKLSKLR